MRDHVVGQPRAAGMNALDSKSTSARHSWRRIGLSRRDGRFIRGGRDLVGVSIRLADGLQRQDCNPAATPSSDA